MLYQPLGMTGGKRQIFCCMAFSFREFCLFRFPCGRAQDGIHELYGSCVSIFFCKLYALIASSRGGDTFQEEELVDAKPQDGAEHRVDFLQRARDIALQYPIYGISGLHRPVDQFRAKPAVYVVEARSPKLLRQRHIRIGTLLPHLKQHPCSRISCLVQVHSSLRIGIIAQITIP